MRDVELLYQMHVVQALPERELVQKLDPDSACWGFRYCPAR